MSSSLPASSPLRPSRAVGWRGVTLITILFLALLLGLFALEWRAPYDLFRAISRLSGGVLPLTFLFYVVTLAVMLLVMFGIQRLKPADIGLVWANVYGGVLTYLAIWVGYQILLAGLSIVSGGHIRLETMWSTAADYPLIAGRFITYVFGTALTEEIIFRGYLLPQCWLALRTIGRPWPRLGLALLISQGIFALVHIPATLLQGASIGDLLIHLVSLFVLGVLLALVYLQTRNLFVVVAIHSLSDWPMPLFHQSVLGDLSLLSFVALVAVLLLWPIITRQSGLREMAQAFRAGKSA